MAIITINVPDGEYCTGCPCSTYNTSNFEFVCTLLHTTCKAEGVCQNRAIKNPKCPARLKGK